MNVKEVISEIVLRNLNTEEYFLVDIQENISHKPGSKIVIFLDGDKGITIEYCAQVARKISAELETLEFLDSKYTLEVSSPGVDQPLRLKRQYYKNIGRRIKVTLKDNAATEIGFLEAVNENEIVLQTNSLKKTKNKQSINIPFENIEKVNVLVLFNSNE